MTLAIQTKIQRPERDDKGIRISAATWEKLRNVRVQMTSESGDLIDSHDEVLRRLIDAYTSNGARQ